MLKNNLIAHKINCNKASTILQHRKPPEIAVLISKRRIYHPWYWIACIHAAMTVSSSYSDLIRISSIIYSVLVKSLYLLLTFFLFLAGLSLTLINYQQAFAQNLFDAQHYQPLTADQRAHKIGDIITVLILQNSTARSSADLSTNKNMNINAQANANGTQNKVGAGVGVSDNGSGETSRGGNLKAVISVTIRGIDSNSNYLIKGEQEMLINGEKQSITLSGSVRSTDISSNNTIYSSQIANANISYTGDGALSAAQRHGIFYRIFSFLGLI